LSLPSDRSTVARTVRDLVLAVVQRGTPAGTSVVIGGPPGIGKTFLVREILDSLPLDEATVLRVAGEQGRRNDPFTLAGQLLGAVPPGPDPGDAAFDHVDELCASGPVVLCADDAHHLDAASLTVLRRLIWASRSLPLAVLGPCGGRMSASTTWPACCPARPARWTS
jgi:predicted ATPase